MDAFEELNRQGMALLAELADSPGSECWRRFDALFYEVVWQWIRAHHATMTARVARYLQVEGIGGADILPEEVDEVAHEATKLALQRVRKNASRFDPNRGTPIQWVIGAAAYAYVDEARKVVKARHIDKVVALEDIDEPPDLSPTPEERVLRRLEDTAALDEAASHLSEKEFAAIRLVITAGYSYAEVARMIFGNQTMTKQVDGLLTRAKTKLAQAWANRKAQAPIATRPTVVRRIDGEGDR